MKKIVTLILGAALTASMIAGCGGQLNGSDPSSTIPTVSESTQATETSSAPVTDGPRTFEELYGNQIMNYLDHQYYFDGKPIMKQEANFYFINSFLEMSNDANMGYYPMTSFRYIDLAAKVEGESNENIGDVFLRKAEEDLETAFIKLSRATAEGVTLPSETSKQIDEWINSIKTESAPASGMSVDEYLQMWYGPGMSEDILKAIVERYFLIEEYENRFTESYEMKNDEKKLPCVTYAIFYAPEKSNIDKDTKESILEAAKSMKESCKSIADLKSLTQQAYQYGAVQQQGDMVVKKEKKIKKVEEWAYSKDRKEGDIDIIYESEWGYYVVGYMGTLQEQIQIAPSIRYALFYVDKDAEQSLKDKALADANAMKNACKSVDDLTGLAESAYAKGTVLDQGDFMITKEMEETMAAQKFKEWGLDKNRKEGDIEVIYDPDFGYFVVGYLGMKEYRSDALSNYSLQVLNENIKKEFEGKKHDFHTDDKFDPAPAAPTVTPTPVITEEPVQTLNPDATVPSGEAPAQSGSSMTTTDVLVVVFITLAGVAILAVIAILINHAIKNGKNGGVSGISEDEFEDESEDEGEEEDGEDSGDEEEDEYEKSEGSGSDKDKKEDSEEDEDEDEDSESDEEKDE